MKPFSSSVIKKTSRYNKIFKNLKHRDYLVKEAGSSGFSNLQMEKKLKEMGYDAKRRKAAINLMLGGKGGKLSMEEISALSKDDIKKLPWLERERVRKIEQVKKQRNINRGMHERYSEEQVEAKQKGMAGIQKNASMGSRGARLGFAGQSGEVGGFNRDSGLGIKKRGTVFAGSLNKKPDAPPPSNSPAPSRPTIPLARL